MSTNPVYRARRAVGLTQGAFGDALNSHLSPTHISNMEEGMLLRISHRIYDEVCELVHREFTPSSPVGSFEWPVATSYRLFEAEYQAFRETRQSIAGLHLRRFVNYALRGNPHEHPHAAFRRLAVGPELRKYCRLMCLPTESVKYYERSRNPALPVGLKEAYESANLEMDHIIREVRLWLK